MLAPLLGGPSGLDKRRQALLPALLLLLQCLAIAWALVAYAFQARPAGALLRVSMLTARLAALWQQPRH